MKVSIQGMLLVVAVTGGGACSGASLPATFPVTGKVVYHGGEALRGGFVQFTSTAEPNQTVAGSIQPDGTFTLSTVFGAQKVVGARPGPHHARVVTPQGKGLSGLELERPGAVFEVEARDNFFLIEVKKPRPTS
jgi:hypothetical protein